MPSPALVKHATKSELLQRQGRATGEGYRGGGGNTAYVRKHARSQDSQEGTARKVEVIYT